MIAQDVSLIEAEYRERGFSQLEISPLRAQASGRRFYRVRTGQASSVACLGGSKAPQDMRMLSESAEVRLAAGYDCAVRRNVDSLAATVCITHWLRKRGVRVPKVEFFARQSGLIAFTDLGDASFLQWRAARSAAPPGLQSEIEAILDAARSMHRLKEGAEGLKIEVGDLAWIVPTYDSIAFASEACRSLFQNGDPVGPSKSFELWRETYDATFTQARRLNHKDFHMENLLVFRNEPYFIDVQDAVFCDPILDVGGFIWDPRHKISQDDREEVVCGYFEDDVERHNTRAAIVGIAKLVKCIAAGRGPAANAYLAGIQSELNELLGLALDVAGDFPARHLAEQVYRSRY